LSDEEVPKVFFYSLNVTSRFFQLFQVNVFKDVYLRTFQTGRWRDLVTAQAKPPVSDGAEEQQMSQWTKNIPGECTGLPGITLQPNGATQSENFAVQGIAGRKGPAELSPEREFSNDPLDAAAAFFTISKALFAASKARASTSDSVDDALDFMMDVLFSSFAPLLTLTRHLAGNMMDHQTEQNLWEACAIHTRLPS
uniref:VPS9 domain-containing protein n=1 Tax=Gongylonema pulchrum TaxID=637853 RepID=A0A183E0K3_9BILA